jgi:dihydrofolate reductase
MRKLMLFADVTLDGFMAGPQNDLDFVVPDGRLIETVSQELPAAADTIVVGRKSFSDMADYWTKATGPLARWMNETPKVVLSNTLDDATKWQNTTVARGDGAEAVQRLKQDPGKAVVVFGGVQTVQSLVGAGLVDEYWLKVNPVAVGRGGAVFGAVGDQATLTLSSARSFPSGTVALIYRR